MPAVIARRLRTVRVVREEPAGLRAGSPAEAVAVLRGVFADLDQDREHVVLLALDGQNRVRGYKVVGTGSRSECLIDPKLIFRDALLLGASRIILAHQHPSGDPTPSPADLAIARQIADAGRILDLPLVDAVVLGDGWHVSLAERGELL